MSNNPYKFWRVSDKGDLIQVYIERKVENNGNETSGSGEDENDELMENERIHTDHRLLEDEDILDEEFRLLSYYRYEDHLEFYFAYMEALRRAGHDRIELKTAHNNYVSPLMVETSDKTEIPKDINKYLEDLNSNKYSGRWKIDEDNNVVFIDDEGEENIRFKAGELLDRNLITEVFEDYSIDPMLREEFYYIYLDALRNARIGSVTFSTEDLSLIYCCDKIREE